MIPALCLWAADLIDIIPPVIISHLDKMYCVVTVQVWVYYRSHCVWGGPDIVTALAGWKRSTVTYQSRFWLTESLVTSHHSITTICGESGSRSRCYRIYILLWLQPTKPIFSFNYLLMTLLYAWALGFFVNASTTLQTCEGHSYDSYNYVLGRWSLPCNKSWWGAAGSDSRLITCQQHVKLNMGPLHLGHVMSYTLWGV